MRILVTGGAGFIGSHIVDSYIAAGHSVAVVDNLWEHGGKASNVNPKADFFKVDIRDQAALASVFDEVKPEVVNHQAAQMSVFVSTQDPKFDAEVNIIGLFNVLENAGRVGTRKIIFASTGAVYGSPDHFPITEKSELWPESPYGISKMAGEHYLREWALSNGRTYTILRYANIYGPRQDPYGEAGVIAIFINRFLTHQSIRIDWDGNQQRDFLYVGDLVRMHQLVLNAGDNEIFCVGTGVGTSVNEIYEHLAAILGYRPEIIRAPKRPGDFYKAYFSYSKAQTVLGWEPQVTLREGLKETVEFFRNQ
ncbi:MAG TPA: NAD-dependent epimerase/dehydratase family protein [Ktedonobacteraceae bacterium]|nr:NAD-dependent epimerase/dehydratase family protein [Ktedonobacteraceae bacterium]